MNTKKLKSNQRFANPKKQKKMMKKKIEKKKRKKSKAIPLGCGGKNRS